MPLLFYVFVLRSDVFMLDYYIIPVFNYRYNLYWCIAIVQHLLLNFWIYLTFLILIVDKFDQFWSVNKKLMESSGDETFKYIPYRLYMVKHYWYCKVLIFSIHLFVVYLENACISKKNKSMFFFFFDIFWQLSIIIRKIFQYILGVY